MIYGLMSLLNILCGIVTPSYTAVYMVENSVMREAIRRGGVFDGVVGELAEDLTPDEHGKFRVMILEGSAQNETTQLPLTEPPAARSGQKKPYSTSAILNGRLVSMDAKISIKDLLSANFYQFKTAIPLLRFIPWNLLTLLWPFCKRSTRPPAQTLTSAVSETEPGNKTVRQTTWEVDSKKFWKTLKSLFHKPKSKYDPSKLPERFYFKPFERYNRK
jgi:hypothetical protein